MQEQIEMIKKHLTEIGEELFKKYGTDSYEIRCMIYDVKDSVSKLHQPTVSEQVNEVGMEGHENGCGCWMCNDLRGE